MPAQVQWNGTLAFEKMLHCSRRCVLSAFRTLSTLGYITPENFVFKNNHGVITFHLPPVKAATGVVEIPQDETESSSTPARGMPVEDVELVCKSLRNMSLYIQFGIRAVKANSAEGIKPTPLNWQTVAGYSKEDPQAEKWSTEQFAGYWWYLWSWHQERYQFPLRLPDWSRLKQEVKRWPASRTELYRHMRSLVANYPSLLYMLRDSKIHISFHEGTFNHRLAKDLMSQLATMSPEEQLEAYNGGREIIANMNKGQVLIGGK